MYSLAFMSVNAFIVDVGSQSIKLGVSTAAEPTVVPAICGTPRFPPALRPAMAEALGLRLGVVADADGRGCVGREAMDRRAMLRLRAPVQRGIVQDWEAAGRLLAQAGALAAAQEHHSTDGEGVLALIEHPLASRKQRQRLVEYYLEGGGEDWRDEGDEQIADASRARLRREIRRPSTDGQQAHAPSRAFTGVFCGVAPLLALYATGRTTGVALEVGHNVTSTAAAIAGRSVPGALHRQDGQVAGGDAVTRLFEQLLRQDGALSSARDHREGSYAFPRGAVLGTGTAAERERLREIKEKVCCVSATPLPVSIPWGIVTPSTTTHTAAASGDSTSATLYRLPDGTDLEISATARLYASEVLFNPALVGSEERGIGALLDEAMSSAGPEAVVSLCQHIVVSGGTSLTSGFARRCFREVQCRVPAGEAVRVVAPAERGCTPWFGASLLSQLSSFASDMVVTRADYEENGEPILHARLFT